MLPVYEMKGQYSMQTAKNPFGKYMYSVRVHLSTFILFFSFGSFNEAFSSSESNDRAISEQRNGKDMEEIGGRGLF
jgi:hypothetical protein